MAGGIPPEWAISEEDSIAIFNETIAPQELGSHLHIHHQVDGKRPLAVLIVGQTGAGKTRLAPDLKQAMTAFGRDPNHFIADTYKTYHPHYAEALRTAPKNASIVASSAARLWLTMACEAAVANRSDVLVESACRHPDDFCRLAEIFHDGGYLVKVAIMAVPEALSRLGILVRYYRNLPEAQSRGLPLRLTPKKVHDDSYAGLAYAAKFIDEHPIVDGIVVVRRNNLVTYENGKGGAFGGWQSAATAAAALEIERKRKLSPEEAQAAQADIEELKKLEDSQIQGQIQEIETSIAALDGGLAELKLLDAAAFVGKGLD
ncbi:hypothetical protein GQ53DRAFT_78127 [Thozetella sp. PMI_491]|nr:hypothetical protein GQ53DRAFT_78127 [Thozetella sp. PMI_491]